MYNVYTCYIFNFSEFYFLAVKPKIKVGAQQKIRILVKSTFLVFCLLSWRETNICYSHTVHQ